MTKIEGQEAHEAAEAKTFVVRQTRNLLSLGMSEGIELAESQNDDELVMLEASRVVRERLADWQLDLVKRLRDRAEPVTWAEIGEALGMTKQGAVQRYAKLMPPRTYYSF